MIRVTRNMYCFPTVPALQSRTPIVICNPSRFSVIAMPHATCKCKLVLYFSPANNLQIQL